MKYTFINEGGEENEVAILKMVIEYLCETSPILNTNLKTENDT